MSSNLSRLHISSGKFYDQVGRQVILRGINVDGSAKYPFTPDQPSHEPRNFLDADDVSFVNRPFPLDEAPEHFARLRRWGYTTIRWIYTWEAIEHAGPRRYDDAFVEYTVDCLRIAKAYGFKVIMDPHQDVWSRFSGGSGAPLWTLYACGLDPQRFLVTESALVQNTWPDVNEFPKMIWATNYYRLCCQVMFTLFFAGRDFAPLAKMDGVNIQDYLQDHFLGAVRYLAERIANAGDLLDEVVMGWESLNEPNRGLVGAQDLTVVPKEQKLQKGTSPTAWQAILLGSGRACEVETWDVGGMGPFKTGTILVDPQGESAWLPADYDDTKYGWKRDPDWKLGECIWAQHGVWDPSSDSLLKKDYFAKDPRNGNSIDYLYFTNHWFLDFFRKTKVTYRSLHKDAIVFCQPPTLEIPPGLKSTADADPNVVFCPHWYDGLTLMTKKWNSWWNVDVFGVLRGRYLSPVFAIKVGETAIRHCFRDQLAAMRQEGLDQMGDVATVFTETGICFDMNGKAAYEDGDYGSQVAALDAIQFGLEGSGVQGYTLWNYTGNNTHQWGDNWNGEDLSIFSLSDPSVPSPLTPSLTSPSSASFSASSQTSLKQPPCSSAMAASPTSASPPSSFSIASTSGFRAASAHIRPWPLAVHGAVRSYGFDLAACSFSLSLAAGSATPDSAPSLVLLPDWHYPPASTVVEVSGGRWAIVSEGAGVGDGEGEEAAVQVLRWWHGEGEQSLTVRGLVRKPGKVRNDGEEELGYLDQCRAQGTGKCVVM